MSLKLSKEELRATFERERIKRTDWPADFETAMSRGIIRAMIYALSQQHRAMMAKAPAITRKHQAQRPTVSSIVNKRRGLDRKSLAAGEKPEPDDD